MAGTGRFYSKCWRGVVPAPPPEGRWGSGRSTWLGRAWEAGSGSEQEGDDGHAQGRVVSELLQVAAVLALGPDGHLSEAHQGEEGHCGAEQGRQGGAAQPRWAGPRRGRDSGLTWETLCHDGKANPGPHLWGEWSGVRVGSACCSAEASRPPGPKSPPSAFRAREPNSNTREALSKQGCDEAVPPTPWSCKPGLTHLPPPRKASLPISTCSRLLKQLLSQAPLLGADPSMWDPSPWRERRGEQGKASPHMYSWGRTPAGRAR